jgi:hypothetical protein
MKPFFGWAMVDSGASSCFINKNLIDKYHIPLIKKSKPRKLKVIDDREISSGLVEYECTFSIELGSHKEELKCNVADIGRHSIVLGMSWLKLHNPDIDWPLKRISFTSAYCSSHCLSSSPTILGNIGGHPDHLEGVPDELGGIQDSFEPLGVPRTTGGVVDIPLEGIPVELRDFADVFSEDKVTELPPHRPYDLEITLKDPDKIVKGPVYPLRPSDDEELR